MAWLAAAVATFIKWTPRLGRMEEPGTADRPTRDEEEASWKEAAGRREQGQRAVVQLLCE